jgi:glycosyltransferase 2 family protein
MSRPDSQPHDQTGLGPPPPGQEGRRKVPWWRILLGLCLLLVLVFFLVDLETAWRHLRQADPLFLLCLLILLSADRLLMSWKWTLLLSCRGVALSQATALKAYYLGTFAGSFLPTTLGSDALRVASVSGPGRPSEVVAASVIMERALGMAASALAALLAVILLAEIAIEAPPGHLAWTAGLTLGLAALIVLGLLWSLSLGGGKLALRLQERLLKGGRVARWLGRLTEAYLEYRQHPLRLGLFLLLSFVEQMVPVLANWLSAKAFGIDFSLLAATAATPVAMSLARLPVWFSGFGVVEGLFVFFFSLVGLGTTQAFLLGLSINVFSLLTALPGLYFYLTGGWQAEGLR